MDAPMIAIEIHGDDIRTIHIQGSRQLGRCYRFGGDEALYSFRDDDVTVHLTVGFNPLGGSILGQAQSATEMYSYSAFRQGLASDISSGADATATIRAAESRTRGKVSAPTRRIGRASSPEDYRITDRTRR